MKTQHKLFGTLAACALAAGLLGTAKPASAAGLTHFAPSNLQAVIAQHFGGFDENRDHDFRGSERRREEFRRSEFQRERREEIRREEARREFREDRRGERRDWNQGHYDRQGDSLQIIVR